MAELLCPQDPSPMRSYERNEITIERCSECGGIFLDRGELDRLVDAEGQYVSARLAGPGRERYADDRDDDDRYRGADYRGTDYRDDDDRYRDDDDRYRRRGRRREGFLGELLDSAEGALAGQT